MAGFVVDASAVVELLARSPAGRQVEALLAGSAASAPAHLDAEVLSALGRLVRAGALPEGPILSRLQLLARAPIPRYPLQPLLAEAWELRHNVEMRDALYITLARRLEATLLTADQRLSRAPRLGVPVTLVGP